MSQQILEMPFRGMDTCVSTPSERGSGGLEYATFGANLVYCIMCALPNLLSGVSTVGSFLGTKKLKVYVIKVW
jgi:hypothetical protein